MIIPEWLPTYGDPSYRGPCPAESAEQISFFNQLRKYHPDLASLVFHPRMEGKRTRGQTEWQQADGSIVAGVADVIGIGCPPLVMELKRRDPTKSRWQPGQVDFLKKSLDAGAFVCLCLGYVAALEALEEWVSSKKNASAVSG